MAAEPGFFAAHLMEQRELGGRGPEVSALGLGCFGMSHAYGNRNQAESIETILRAIELGCTFLDTADEYGAGANELLVGRALAGRRAGITLATKFGFIWDDRGNTVGLNGSRQYAQRACEASLRRLQTDYIDLYYLHRVDPHIPIEETVSAMAELVQQGKVRYLGLSEVSGDLLRRADAIHPIAVVQSEFSLWWRAPSRDILPTCRELGIGFVAFSPLGRGFLTGRLMESRFPAQDFRSTLPRFQPENFRANSRLVHQLIGFSEEKRCSISQLALAWVLAQGRDVVAIPGASTIPHLEENLGALHVQLISADLVRIDEILSANPIRGSRYSETSVFAPPLQSETSA